MEVVEILHAQLVRIEALARVACEAADQLRPPSTREAKRELIRLQIFAGQTAVEASDAVARGDRLMAELKSPRRRRRAARGTGESPTEA